MSAAALQIALFSVCPHCGDAERVEVFDYFASGEFMLDTCCEGMRDAANEYLAEDPKAAALWLESLGHDGDDTPVLRNLRRVIDDDGQLLLDHNLVVVPVTLTVAKAFVLEHHRHCPPPAGWRFGAAVMNGAQMIAVVCVGRPVARALDHTKVVEVNRLCVRTDVPTGYVWNACSLLYGWAAREAKKRGFARVITYTLDTEPGTSLKAAGWLHDGSVQGRKRGWRTGLPTTDKTRWARDLGARA